MLAFTIQGQHTLVGMLGGDNLIQTDLVTLNLLI